MKNDEHNLPCGCYLRHCETSEPRGKGYYYENYLCPLHYDEDWRTKTIAFLASTTEQLDFEMDGVLESTAPGTAPALPESVECREGLFGDHCEIDCEP